MCCTALARSSLALALTRHISTFPAPPTSLCCTGHCIPGIALVPPATCSSVAKPVSPLPLQVDISTFPGTPGRRVLHWAVDDWQKPDQAIWPAGTVSVDDKAVQTPVHEGARIQMTLPKV